MCAIGKKNDVARIEYPMECQDMARNELEMVRSLEKKSLESLVKRMVNGMTFEATFKEHAIVVGHLCGSYSRKPNPKNVDGISSMKACNSIIEVRRFLEARASIKFKFLILLIRLILYPNF